jgi:penicillin amidase
MKRLLVVLIVALVIAAAGTGWWWVRGSLPILDGQLTLKGLHRPVEVLVDAHGVPAVYAAEAEDAWFAAGALHARDRRWQMELYRRVTLGRLSEVLGSATIPIDQRFLTLGLRDAAKAEWERASPNVRAALERYAAGVNAASAQLIGRKRPIEFQMLGITPPPWEPIDSLAVGRLLAWRLSENHQAELVRGALAAKFGEETARFLTGKYPASAPSILTRPPANTANSIASKATEPLPPGLEWLAAGARRGNSNSWVLAGGRTKNGRPILANDPHLQIEFPSVWYELHLVSPDFDVIGVTIPGVPFVALGHNARIAWGMTATGADVQDLVIERVDVGKKASMYHGEWTPIQTTVADIPVRGRSKPLPFEIWKTKNGPIFADVDPDWDAPPSWLSPDDRPAEEQRAYSLRWDSSGDLATAFEAIDRATDWNTFATAIGAFATPSMNIVYADVDGNVGYAMSGRLPVRANGDGALPSDGNNSAGWTGTIESSALPRDFNPASGLIYSANNEIDRGFSGLITRDWIAGFRASRLRDQLSNAQGVDLDAMAALQNDHHSVAADLVLAGLPDAIKTGRARDSDIKWAAMLEKLAAWDRVVDARPIVSLYEAFEDALWRRTFQDELAEPLFSKFYEWAGAEKPAGLYSVIEDRNSRWFDDITTVEKKETRDDIFLLAIRDADEKLQVDWGGDDKRRWDRVHAARFNHPLGSIGFPARWFLSRGPVPVDGDGTTLMRISWNRMAPFGAWEHPSWRQLLDVGEWDSSRVILPAGQSGNPMSPNYFDQNDAWRKGQYRSEPFSRSAVQAAAKHRLLLVP